METSTRIAQHRDTAQRSWDIAHSLTVEREVHCAGSQLKRIICSHLLGEISEHQFDRQRTELLQQIRLLTQ